MKIKEVADLAGVSVRTLHHYDEIGLLSPKEREESGYRVYAHTDLEKLQQILFFKELGFPLKKIKEIINDSSFNQKEALENHYKMLLDKRRRIDSLIGTVEKTIQYKKGEIGMTDEERFAGFDFSENPYEQEARDLWGEKTVNDSNAKIGGMSKQQRQELGEEFNEIYRKLAEIRHEAPNSEDTQKRIEEWYDYLNKIGDYSLDAFKGLGQMYVDDERFTKNIDRFGEGLAVFMRDAMAYYSDLHQ